MSKHWWIENWWVLAALAYCVVLAVLVRGGAWAKHGPKIVLAVTSVIILLIPAMPSPGNYVNAVLVVLNLLVLFRTVFVSEAASKSADR
ncbi:hypothetical protein [Mycolicibacterium sp. CBMA 226]|uniref:hypothetical protein n=1 Tax=Mycolicibacterium sp. CBMA 226 TaxID=2606611 RepID=UPI0012DD7335|nr:hypothetical protein [Mycolicibacterium sp. CBMA 226]MUL78945.1 hypothetical protein [Mycolicibacterium sp. CBMA 226]QGW61254.1 hypothetical protein ICEMyc226_00222 [Mycolicibacterium sp.]